MQHLKLAVRSYNTLASAQQLVRKLGTHIAAKKWLWIPAAALVATFIVVGQPAAPKAINLATDPLFSNPTTDKPVMALALSVEFPTVGAQYRGSNDYTNTNEYLGYYDAESCYTYNNAPTEARPTGVTLADYKRFDKSGPATTRMCTNAFSGNFLNWVSSSSIDMLRLALSGGDRVVDTPGSAAEPSLTILQRAVLPNGDPTCMWNSGSNFPAKQLSRAGGSSGSAYFGAVPVSMRTSAGTSDIWVANTLNQIYFGTSQGGGCGDTGSYRLGVTVPPSPVQKGPSATSLRTLPTNAVLLGGENDTYLFPGQTREIWFGDKNNANQTWTVLPAAGGIDCFWQGGGGPYGGINDPLSGVLKQCYWVPYTANTWTPTSPTVGLNDEGYFFSRVQVCNVSTTTPATLLDQRDYNFCTKYPSGFFKPTGSIQKYSDQLRLAAFGYLMDQTKSNDTNSEGTGLPGRYGGVLRAPMKFVGSKTFNENGTENTPTGGNTAAEWSAITGVFNINPDNDTTQATPTSGVINYLNKFGRTGPVFGRYKKYDPVGEMYGEALRYLQGLQPTPTAVSGITPAMYDGFPAFTSWTDPYGGSRLSTSNYSCLKSNIVVVGDVNTWDSGRLLSRAANPANNLPDFGYWQGIVNNFESNTSSSYVDGQGSTRTTGNPNTPNYSSQTARGSGQQVLTGQAYWARTQDIRGSDWTAGSGPGLQRPGLRVKSFFFDTNENGSSDSTSYRQKQNQFFTAAKYGGFETDASNTTGKPYNTYGNPFKRQDGTNDNNVWQKPTAPGEAGTHYLSSSARATLTAFDSIFASAATSARSIAGAASVSRNIDVSGNVVYQGGFDATDWSGDVTAVPLLVSASNEVTVGAALWNSATQLGLLPSPATTRNIVVGRAGATANPTASAFTWAGIASNASLLSNLSKSSPIATPDSLGQDRLNFLRGDRSKEGNPFRVRNKLLGDIVNSGVVFSGTPTVSFGGGNGYTAFYTANAARTPAVFVGANDGMLHAFNATNGNELFGFIPSWMGPKLSALAEPNYVGNHQAYVDATPVVSEAQVGSTNTAADWKTVLVSGTGAGGPGVFALDVTNPSAFSASNVMWEFTRNDDPDMGYVMGRPQIVKMKTSAPGAAPTYRWFAAVASGINNYVADTSGAFTGATINTTGGNPALFLLALDKPAGTAWTATGSTPNYWKISLPVDSALSAANAPGLINFRPIFGAAREVTQIYMGDLHGKVWKLDFTLQGASNWTMYKLSPYKNVGASAPYPLFIAKNATGGVQPITMAPSVVAGPTLSGIRTYYIAFTTGKYLEVPDKTSTGQNSAYAIYDNGTTTADNSPAGESIISGRGRLRAGSIDSVALSIAVPSFVWGRATSDGDTTQRSGWFVDFAVSGERGITNSTTLGDRIQFSTIIPAAAGVVGSCVSNGGSSKNYSVNIDTGQGTLVNTGGLSGEAIYLELTPTYSTSDSTGAKEKKIITQTINITTGGVVVPDNSSSTSPTTRTETLLKVGRLSWRQINNYQDLRNAP